MAEPELRAEQFDVGYRLSMILAYPVIAEMSRAQVYTTSRLAKDRAFKRLLANRNLQATHRQYLQQQRSLD